jgi:hypothetical protein
MDPALGDDDRDAHLERLDRLEAQAEDASRRMAVAVRPQLPAPTGSPSLDAVQSALQANEALLSYQVGIWTTYEGEFGGGSWLLVVTRDRRAVYRIPDRSHFAPAVPMFTGLVASTDGTNGIAGARLYRDVFATALDDLPAQTNRLIIIPDGPLHNLPFDALRSAPGALPVAARYELAVAPSAAFWLESRTRPLALVRRRALVLADPDVGEWHDATDRNAAVAAAARLGRLPHARRESRAIGRHLAAADALVGRRASEHAIKALPLHDYRIVHFAAHAVADDGHPDRSAVFLAPGGPFEDGLLQPREISQLELDGRIVVLSACDTASGTVLDGEGVLSLARAFFEAGARAVIGTRWAVRDGDSASLFDAFYRELARGASLSEALARAKAEAIEAHRPEHVWAGVVLLGDGAVRPFASASAGDAVSRPWLAWIPAAAGLAVFAVAAAGIARAIASR